MRNNENNIIFNVRNITLNLKNITAYFTEKEKFLALRFKNIILNYKNITLSLLILTLSSINIINTFTYISNVSALDYSSNVGVGFTFNPTLSVSLSSSDLVISNLAPGSSADSNSINVSVATNAAYGYTLSAIMDGDNSNLTHSNSIDTFNSIDPSANLETLTVDNTWGYTSKLNNETIWNNYNGLSSSSNAILLNNSNAADSTGGIDFKIAAKAGSTQPSGEYTGTINFIAISKVAPMSLLDSFIASGAEQLNGYFKMQDMTHDICEAVDVEESELQLIDVRDNKIYWVAKLKDGNCWMTQNLDLDLSHEVALTSETSDIEPESYGTTIYTSETGYSKDEITGVVSWLPSTIDSNSIQRADTIVMSGNTATGWTGNNNSPYSANPGNRYRYTNSSTYNETMYTSLQDCANTNNNDISGCQHTHFGNYYNWSAAVASNNTNGASGSQTNSVCPKNWGLPDQYEYGTMLQAQKIYSGSSSDYASNGFNKIRTTPLYYQQFGYIEYNSYLVYLGSYGRYWSNTNYSTSRSYYLSFNSNSIDAGNTHTHVRFLGLSIRCLAK